MTSCLIVAVLLPHFPPLLCLAPWYSQRPHRHLPPNDWNSWTIGSSCLLFNSLYALIVLLYSKWLMLYSWNSADSLTEGVAVYEEEWDALVADDDFTLLCAWDKTGEEDDKSLVSRATASTNCFECIAHTLPKEKGKHPCLLMLHSDHRFCKYRRCSLPHSCWGTSAFSLQLTLCCFRAGVFKLSKHMTSLLSFRL